MNKKIIFVMLVVSIMSFNVFAETFTDVPSDHWAKTYIEEMADAKLLLGYGNGLFKPLSPISKWEALILSSRILGFNEARNNEIKNLAFEHYESELDKYNVNNKAEIAYLLYWGALTSKDLDTYLTDANKNSPLLRYEAAILMTKVMGGEQEALGKLIRTSEYLDESKIPAGAKPYVEYVGEKKVMLGVGENKFEPMLEVNRAQMATMMLNTMRSMNHKPIAVTIQEVNIPGNKITLKDVSGASFAYPLQDTTLFRINGKPAAFKDFKVSQNVTVYFQDSKLRLIEGAQKQETLIEGIVSSVSQSGSQYSLTLTLDDDEKQTITFASSTEIQCDGSISSFSQIKRGYFVQAYSDGSSIYLVKAQSGDKKVSGEVTKITIQPNTEITVRLDDGTVEKYTVSDDDVTVKRNGSSDEFKNLLIGDYVTLTLELNKIVNIVAKSTSDDLTGTIEQIVLSSVDPYITIRTAEGVISVRLVSATEYILDGQPSDMYSLRLGALAELTLENDSALVIETSAVSLPSQIVGVVRYVNTSYNIVGVEWTNNGSTQVVQTVMKSDFTLIDQTSTKVKNLKNLEAGRTVVCVGTLKNGVYEVKTLMITE